MTRFYFDLARPEDDAQLRAILAATPMAGRIAVTFRREPNYFDAAVVDGHFRQVVVARDRDRDDKIAGFGSRSIRHLYVNGEPRPVGYLSQLRLLPEYRGFGTLLVRGYRYFRELHNDRRAPFYLTTIAHDNTPARSALEGGRGGLPMYHDAGLFHTLAIPLGKTARKQSANSSRRLKIRPAAPPDMPALLAFWSAHGPRRQFFPSLLDNDFSRPDAMLRDLHPRDILIALRGPEIVGTFGAWNQQPFRQSVVHTYRGTIAWFRPFYNMQARLRRRPLLPSAGEPIRALTAALPLARDDDASILTALIDSQLQRVTVDPSGQFMLIGFHERDPLLAALHAFPGKWYSTRMYIVCWQDGEASRSSLNGRVPWLELGTL